MATNFQTVDTLGSTDKLLISCYLKSINHSQFDVPPLVYNLCVLYWMQSDHYAEHGDDIVIDDIDDEDKADALSTAKMNSDVDQQQHSVYGDFAINDDNTRAVYQWTFKMGQNQSRNTAIGICTTTQYLNAWYTWKIGKEANEDFFTFGYETKYTKQGQGDREYPNLNEGDTVLMECDIAAKTLTFKVNEDPRVAIFDGIDYAKTYKVAIVLCDRGDAVKMMSFKRWNSANV